MNKIVITWVSEGLWYELAKLYLEKWFEVIGISRNKPNLNIIHLKTDLTKEEDINATIWIIKEKYSDFKYLINCAWVLNIEKLWEIDYKNTEKLFKINVIAPIILTSGLINEIKENEADIVNIASTVWLKAYESQCSYGASKWAMRWITENLQLELKNTKSRVIWFNPWWFKSRIFEKATWFQPDLSPFMEPIELAKIIEFTLNLPKNMEVSNITINRK